MKADENKVSKKFKITLTWVSVEDLEDGTKVYRFTDEKTNEGYVHFQIKPSKCANPASAKMAKAFISKIRGYNVGDRLRVEAVFRQMNDGNIFRDVDNVLYVVERRK